MNSPGGRQQTHESPPDVRARPALAWGLFWLAVLGIILYSACNVRAADGPYAPGDTLWYTVAALDSSGYYALPDTASVLFSYGDVDITTQTYPGASIAQVGNLNLLRGAYVIPDTWAHPWTLSVLCTYGEVGGIPQGIMLTDPSRVRVNAATTIDSLSAGAIADLWSGIASGTAAIIDTTDCTPCGVYTSGGTAVSDAPVYITRGSTFSSMADVVGFALSASGFWRVRVPATPGVPDTFYVWAYQQGSYNPGGVRLIVSE